jgi:uncharacterized protein
MIGEPYPSEIVPGWIASRRLCCCSGSGRPQIGTGNITTIALLNFRQHTSLSHHMENIMASQKQGTDDKRGFASMDDQKQREIASEGGKASGGNFKNDPERASEAGKKGGESSRGGSRGSSSGSAGRS